MPERTTPVRNRARWRFNFMDQNYYSDEPGEPKEPVEDKEREESDEETALLPKSLFGDKELEPGKQCKVEIVAVYDDEVEVKYVPHDDSESDDEEMKDPFEGMDE